MRLGRLANNVKWKSMLPITKRPFMQKGVDNLVKKVCASTFEWGTMILKCLEVFYSSL